MDAALRRGISTAYYAIFHDLTRHMANHLLGSCPQEIQNEIRRSWSHGEISQLAKHVLERAKTLVRAPIAPVPGHLEKLGPLLDVAAADAALVETLRLFNDLQDSGTPPTTITKSSSSSGIFSKHVVMLDSPVRDFVMLRAPLGRRCSRFLRCGGPTFASADRPESIWRR